MGRQQNMGLINLIITMIKLYCAVTTSIVICENINVCRSILECSSKDSTICDQCKGNGSFYIAQYPVRWTAQSAVHFLPSLSDMFIPTPTRLLLVVVPILGSGM